MSQHIKNDSSADDNNDDDTTIHLKHIGKHVGKFWGADVFFGTVMDVHNSTVGGAPTLYGQFV